MHVHVSPLPSAVRSCRPLPKSRRPRPTRPPCHGLGVTPRGHTAGLGHGGRAYGELLRQRCSHVSANGRALRRRACVQRARLGAGLGVRGGGPGGHERGHEAAWAGARPSARGTRAGCSGSSHGCGHASRAAASTAPRAARQRTSRGWKGTCRGRGRLDVLASQPGEGHLDDGHGSKRET